LLSDDYAADWLGVGKNMAKSIRHWLVATGLAHRSGSGRASGLETTQFGQLVWRSDPYFCDLGTWWSVHVNLVSSAHHAASWYWFFNESNLHRFERSQATEGLRRHLTRTDTRVPSPRTLDRDVSCLLNSYADLVPSEPTDPEEANDCPMIELGLITGFRASRYYEINRDVKPIPPGVFGYCSALAFGHSSGGTSHATIPVQDLALRACGPGRSFALTSEAVLSLVSEYESGPPNGGMLVTNLAGERAVQLPQRDPIEWLEEHYADHD
jgi:hypothetical protein